MGPANFSWVVPGKLAGMALPGGSLSQDRINVQRDLQHLYGQGVRVLVSLTGAAAGLEKVCREAGLEWHYFPISDFGIPQDLPEFDALMETLLARIYGGSPVCVHCYAGVGRTGLVLCCLTGRLLGLEAAEAIGYVRSRRDALETRDQERFVRRYLERSRRL